LEERVFSTKDLNSLKKVIEESINFGSLIMRKQRIQTKISIRTLLCVLLIIFGISSSSSIRVNAATVSNDISSYSSLTPHASISITSDVELEAFPGSGTAEDPYVIEGYNITTTDETGIYITGTTKYFVVRNCYVDASTYGIYIKSIAYSSASVINNSCWNNFWGILLQSSGGSSVVNNTCNDNNWYGIQLQSSGGSSVVNNTCNNSGVGIALNGCGSSSIINNTATNCGYSIREGNGAGYLSYTIENNSVNGKELGIYVYLDSTIIDEQIYGQLILIECSNVTVRNQILDNAGTAIYLRYCTNTIITNNTCNNNIEYGINDWYSINISISSNTCGNNGNGIYLFNSVYSYIRDNLCSNNRNMGIYLGESANSTVADNLCNDNSEGIRYWYSNNSTVANNTCNSNTNTGIELDNASNSSVTNNVCNYNMYGVTISVSSFCTIANNTCRYSSEFGITLGQSDYGLVIYNILQENVRHGMLVSESDNNIIHHNNFISNNLGSSQASSGGTNNIWYDVLKLEGNYWDDWSGTGYYVLPGAVDMYPLGEPTVFLGPPNIKDGIQFSSAPTELDLIGIKVNVTSPYGVQSVTLHYRINGGTWIEVSMSPVSDNLYSCTIGTFAVDDIIEFYISATDVTEEHNVGFNDNSGEYYTFTILDSVVMPEFQLHSILTLPMIILLFSVVCLVLKKQYRK